MDIKETLNGIENIGILTKKNANNDAIGASLALFFALRGAGKKPCFPSKNLPNEIIEFTKKKSGKQFQVTFNEEISEVYYEKKGQGLVLYLTPKDKTINDESFSCKVVSGESFFSSEYDVLFTVGIDDFKEVEDLCDAETFLEYGALSIAAQRRRQTFDDLIQNTPADGLVTGIGSVNRNLFTSDLSVNTQCVVLAYDYMVLAGTQGLQNHRKKDRMFELAEKMKIPIILFAEGGGGRPGDTDTTMIAGLDCMAFALYAKLSGLVPRIGIANGRCFAGNAALLGMSDVIIATENSNIGMGGPAMIEGGGLGVYRPEEIGPMSVQRANGVVDVVAKDERDAVEIAKKYLSYFQGSFRCDDRQGSGGDVAEDQYQLRHIIPENRLVPYDIRRLIQILADKGSVLELRSHFGIGIVTSFGRIGGQPIGIIANNPKHLGGAIDSASADKASRFIQLCDAFDIPLLTLCDTPGIMVGPDIEKTALVRHVSRLFVTSATVTIPVFAVVLRKGYGLGAQAMAGGSFKLPSFTITWPTGEFGGMGLEGAVRLGYKKDMAKIAKEEDRERFFEDKVKEMYEVGKAVNYATAFELDGVIDPKDTRTWIINGMKTVARDRKPREGKKRPMIDTW